MLSEKMCVVQNRLTRCDVVYEASVMNQLSCITWMAYIIRHFSTFTNTNSLLGSIIPSFF